MEPRRFPADPPPDRERPPEPGLPEDWPPPELGCKTISSPPFHAAEARYLILGSSVPHEMEENMCKTSKGKATAEKAIHSLPLVSAIRLRALCDRSKARPESLSRPFPPRQSALGIELLG